MAGSVLSTENTGMVKITVAALIEWWGGTGFPGSCAFFLSFYLKSLLCAVCVLHPGEERRRMGPCS